MLARGSKDTIEVRKSSQRVRPRHTQSDKRAAYDEYYSPHRVGDRLSARTNSPRSRRSSASIQQSPQQSRRRVTVRSPSQRRLPVNRPSSSNAVKSRWLPGYMTPPQRSRRNKTVVLTNVQPPMKQRSRPVVRDVSSAAPRRPTFKGSSTPNLRHSSPAKVSRRRLQGPLRSRTRSLNRKFPFKRKKSVAIARKAAGGAQRVRAAQSSRVRRSPRRHDSSGAVSVLNNLLRGVHFNSNNNLFYPGELTEDECPLSSAIDELYEGLRALSLTGHGETAGPPNPAKKRPKKRRRTKKKNVADRKADLAKKQSEEFVQAQLDACLQNKKLNKNQKYLSGQYQSFLKQSIAHNPHPVRTKFAVSSRLLNQNNNANESDDLDEDDEDSADWLDLSDVVSEKSYVEHRVRMNAVAQSEKSFKASVNANNNAVTPLQTSNLNRNSSASGFIHPEVAKLQHLLHQREIQQRDFLEAFTDALLAKEAALSLAQERLETISMLEIQLRSMREEYEAIIEIKDNELRIKNDVIAGYKTERYSLTRAFEKATKCMLAKLSAKNSAIRKMNMSHHDEISQLRMLVMRQETELVTTGETLQRMKIFQEREITIYNQKIRELHDLLKLKDNELHSYHQISADIVHMAEKMNLDLHVKEQVIKQLRVELSNFQVGVNEVEGDRVLVKQCKSDKRVISLGFPRIVDGSVIIWYKSRTHGDNFLVLRVFGGKLFVVNKNDIIAELNRILPNLLNNPTLTHAALTLEKGTQAPQDEKPCAPPLSAMQMQIHMVGNRAHLAMEGRHLCSQQPIMFVDDEQEPDLNKEITPRPYESARSPIERRILLTEDKRIKKKKTPGQSGDDDSDLDDSQTGSTTSSPTKRKSLLERFRDLFRRKTSQSSTGYTPKGATPASTKSGSVTESTTGSSKTKKTSDSSDDSDSDSSSSSNSDSDDKVEAMDGDNDNAENKSKVAKEQEDNVEFKSGQSSKYLLKSIALLENLHLDVERNRSGNARTNYSQNALASDDTTHQHRQLVRDPPKADIDLEKYTDQVLNEMREVRERLDSERSEVTADGDKLTEFEPLYPRQPVIEYSMDWFSETESPKKTKARCRSPKQRLRQLESDIDNLSRIPVATRKKGRQAAQQNDEVRKISPVPEDGYDWSLPELDIPDEFRRSASRMQKKSDHDTRNEEAVKCSINREKQPDERTVFLHNEVELLGWKANTIADDYKYSRLSNDEDLQRFIKENTIEEDKGNKNNNTSLKDIRYNDDTRQFDLVTPSTSNHPRHKRKPRAKRTTNQILGTTKDKTDEGTDIRKRDNLPQWDE